MIAERMIHVCALADLTPDVPRCFRIAQTDILLVRHQEQVYALQNRCGHMSAALHLGTYTDGLIVCPLHGAAFSVESGAVEWAAILPPPMADWVTSSDPRLHNFGQLLDSIETLPIQTYTVNIDAGEVYITLKE